MVFDRREGGGYLENSPESYKPVEEFPSQTAPDTVSESPSESPISDLRLLAIRETGFCGGYLESNPTQ